MRTNLLALLVLLLAQPALAWNDTGHMLVATIALRHMSPAVREQVHQLLAHRDNPQSGKPVTPRDDTDVTAANYMDDIRPTFSSLHYIDQFMDDHGTLLARPAPSPNAVDWIRHNLEVLRTSPSDAARGEAIRYLMHVVGDLHQPLHCAARVTDQFPDGDRGGNDVKIPGPFGNLHWYWDCAAGLFPDMPRPLSPEDKAQLNALASAIDQNPGPEGSDINAQHWIREGFELARLDVYPGVRPGTAPDAVYEARTKAICSHQVALAGYRLAALLTDALTNRSTPAAISSGVELAKPIRTLVLSFPSTR
jgi:hypothetical protein